MDNLSCFVCCQRDELSIFSLASPSKQSSKPVHELIESISGLHVASFQSNDPVCRNCMSMFNSFDEHLTKAMEVKDALSRLLQTTSEPVTVKIEPKAEFYEFDDESNFDIGGETMHETFLRNEANAINLKTFECDLCNRSFSTHTRLMSHKMSHSEIEPDEFQCDVCGKGFPAKYRLNRHKKIHLLEASHRQKEVTKKAKRRSKADKDSTVHQCTLCNKILPTRQSLKTHQAVHSTERNYKCSQCEKDYKDPSSLRMHMLRHTGRRFECDLCGANFVYKQNAISHLLAKHTTRKDFLCSFCPKSYASYSTLHSHLKTHTKPKKEICPVCGAKFRDSYKLGRHIRSHGTFGAFACLLCDKKFKENYNLNRHTREVHEKQKPKDYEKFPCNICDNKFDRKGKLRQHLSKVHHVVSGGEEEIPT